jgi:serine/threonine protein kinase
MGNKTTGNIDRNSFDFLSIIGKGGFGKVWRVRYKQNCQEFALKEMSKAKIIEKNSVSSILRERDILAQIHHPFIINMIFSFQDEDNLYLVTNLFTGGDLRYHMNKEQSFSENETKFFMGCLILGLEVLHTNNIIHRDIKPENLVLDYKGYLKITDFGIAKKQEKQNSNETSGTPGYMAPEVMNFQNHTVAVDYFAMGVICYELMMGVRPYVGESRNEIKEKILARQIVIKSHEIPSGWSKEAADFINSLIQRKPSSRLGFKGINQIKQHKWFNHFSWKDLYNMRIESPYIPSYEDNFDSNYCEREDNISQQEQELLNKIKSSEQYKTIFKNFLFFNMYDERSNSQKTFINPHKKYEEKQAFSSPQKLKSTLPELSDESKEINKFNLFSPRTKKVKHNI